MQYRYLFGPVPSRRLGRSLGVDLTPCKTCSLDCIFCQLGRTTHLTVKRREWVPFDDVRRELDLWFAQDGQADYVTLAGSGEPTLHQRFGDVIRHVRELGDVPVALLSNGTLFFDPEVREAASAANLVKVSLSAWDQTSFGHVNRPHEGLSLERMVAGYHMFRKIYRGHLQVEVFLVWGTNSLPADVERMAALVNEIGADEVHLNTAVRPPAEDFVMPVPRKFLEPMRELFRPRAEMIAEYPSQASVEVATNEESILSMVRRRPCTAEQIGKVFGMHRNEVSKYIGKLMRTFRIVSQRRENELYYTAARE